ncbi:hypothetical protein ACJ41O_009458 [Fusarium nematophilum]
MSTFAYLREQKILNAIYIALLSIEALMVLGVAVMAVVKRAQFRRRLKSRRPDTPTTTHFPAHDFAISDAKRQNHASSILMDPAAQNQGITKRRDGRCPHCEWYPRRSCGFICEACGKMFGSESRLPMWREFRATGEKDWTIYHMIRSGDLPDREHLEQEMRLRLISEHRCMSIKCAAEKIGVYAYCHSCRDNMSLNGYHKEADLKVATPPDEPIPKNRFKSLRKLVVAKVIWPLLGADSDTDSPSQEQHPEPHSWEHGPRRNSLGERNSAGKT